MAEATGLRCGLPYPIYGCPFGFAFPIMEADGDLVTSAANLDSEISLNGDTLGDCTNEATEIGGGLYYLILTAAEMTADVISGVTKTSTADAKTTSWSLYPRKLVTVRSGTAAGGDTGYITLDSGAVAVDDYYNGLVCIATIDSVVEARIITDYTGSNKQAAVTPAWNTAPDADDTFVLKLPEGVVMPTVDVTLWKGAAAAAMTGDAYAIVSNAGYGNSALATLIGDVPTAGENADAVLDEEKGTHAGLLAMALPDAAAGAVGGLPILGSNAAGMSLAGQVKIAANVSGEGALHIVNNGFAGFGVYGEGKKAGQFNLGTQAGAYGQHNKSSGAGGYGQINEAGAAGAGQLNFAEIGYGQSNSGATADVIGDIGDIGTAAAQAIRDALKLAPTAGDPAAGSVDKHLDDILATMALEATLTAMKGAGWTDETLVAIDVLLDAIKAKTDLLAAAGVTVSSPASATGDVTVYQGDDYHNTDGRAIEWSNAAGTWPDLTSATIVFGVRAPNGSSFTATGSVVTPTGAGQKVRVELTATQTALLVDWPTPSELRVRATLASGRKATLVDAELEAIVDIIG